MIAAGIDVGSRTAKVVLVDAATRAVVASGLRDQGVDHEAVADALLAEALDRAGLSRKAVGRIVATGYGRNQITFADRTVTEITCQARGVAFQSPETRLVIEVGGQDSKVIHLNDHGAVHDFAMNDRCAAGSGRFLEMLATRLTVKLDALDGLALRSRAAAHISSMCVVFAETEIIGLLASKCPPEDIVSGVFHAVAQRVCALVGRDGTGPVTFTGGVALFDAMRAYLSQRLGTPVAVARRPQYTGALGAALMGTKK